MANDIPENILKVETETGSNLVDELAKLPLQSSVTEPMKSHRKINMDEEKVWSWAWIFTAFVIGLFVGGLGVGMMTNVRYPISNDTNKVAPTIAATLAPTPEPKLERSGLKIKVLNGSGVTGAASKAKDFLENLGYIGITTGNATDSFPETEISLKPSKKAYLEMLKKDLADKYTLIDTIQDLPESGDVDAIVTLGEK